MALLEQLAEQAYQFVAIDPEGDYSRFEDAIELGDIRRPPSIDEILRVLDNPETDVSVNLGSRRPSRTLRFRRKSPRSRRGRV